jgi:hypothetical protein
MPMQAPALRTSALLAGAILLAGIPASAQIEGSFDRTLHVSGPVELDVTTDSGGISVRPGASGSVHIHAILKGHNSWDSGDADRRIHKLERNPPVEQIGNRVRVGYVTDRSLLRNISMRFEIETPAATQLRARADSGGIEAEGVHGPVDCRTDSGGIQLRPDRVRCSRHCGFGRRAHHGRSGFGLRSGRLGQHRRIRCSRTDRRESRFRRCPPVSNPPGADSRRSRFGRCPREAGAECRIRFIARNRQRPHQCSGDDHPGQLFAPPG